jgi:hypothetical protein
MRCASARIEELVVRLTEVKVELESARAERDRLREALRAWMRWHDEDSILARDEAVALTRAALAKAEGREP